MTGSRDSYAPAAIVASVVDVAAIGQRVRAALDGVREAERAEEAAAQTAEQKREEAKRARLELGRALADARKAWPARGPKAKGWGDFLRAHEIEERSAERYMQLAGHVAEISDTGAGVSEILPTYREAGIDRRQRKADSAPTDASIVLLDDDLEPRVELDATLTDGAPVVKTVEQMIATSRSLLSQAERLDHFAREDVRIEMNPHLRDGLRVGLIAAKTSIEKALRLMGWD